MRDLGLMAEFIQALADVEAHALDSLTPGELRQWDAPDAAARTEFRAMRRRQVALGADEGNFECFVLHDRDEIVVCLGRKQNDEWGFLELDGEARLPLDELILDDDAPVRKLLISYTEHDEVPALALRDALVAAGFDVWIAPKGLSAGERLGRIFDEMGQADAVVVLISQRSTTSPWVKKEMETAVALSLDRGKPLVFPALLESMPLPIALASLRAIVLHGNNFDAGVHDLTTTLRGETPSARSLTSRFADYLHSFDVVHEEVAGGIDRTMNVVQSDYPPRTDAQRTLRANGREIIRQELAKTGATAAAVQRALDSYDRGEFPRVLGGKQRAQALQWLRGAEELTLRFAAGLWSQQSGGRRGVTLEWVFGFLRRTLPEFRDLDYSRDRRQYEWKAHALVDDSLKLGLLIRSSEIPRGQFEQRDAQTNPSYDFGPQVPFIGKLAADFLKQDADRKAASIEPVPPRRGAREEGLRPDAPAGDSPDSPDSLW